MAAQFDVVFVVGEGGCGKSVASLDYLLANHNRLVLSCSASDCGEANVASRLGELRAVGLCEPLPLALERLRVANPHDRSLVLINVDGFDEAATPMPNGPAGLIRSFGPGGTYSGRGTVIVSSRKSAGHRSTRQDYDIVSQCFDCDLPEAFADRVGWVHVGDFDDEEMAQLASRLMPSVRDQLLAVLTVPDRTTQAGIDPEPAAVPLVLESLRHPVVWGTFAELNSEAQVGVLAGEPAGTRQMAELFVRRFEIKSRAREPGLRHAQIWQALEAIARATGNDAAFGRDDWDQRCNPILGSYASEVLLGEAFSYGLFRQDSPTLIRWRHRFVAQWLAGGCR